MDRPLLYDYWRSSASYRVRIALGLAGIDHDHKAIDLTAGEHRRPDYLAINPQGLVPTLVLDGAVLTQSLAIVEYLAERHPDCGLLPADIMGRQRVRALSYAVAMEIHPVCNMHVAAHVVELTGDPQSREDWMRHFITDGLRKLEAMLASSDDPFCHGDRPGMADLCLVPQLYNARRWGADLTGLDRIVDIDARCAALPAFADAHPDRVKP